MIKIKTILFCFLISVQIIFSQNNSPKEYITIIPDSNFAASGFYELIYGAHWRTLWTTPIKVEILDYDKFAGGLIPIKKGGGFQTKSLRFRGNDGHVWKFRSMEKDPSKVLPEALRGTIASDILKDQISSSNPGAPLVVAPILDSIGIHHSHPYLVYLPDSEKLGEFREIFGGLVGYMEIHPDVNEEEGIGFREAENTKTSFKLFHRLEDRRSEKVNSEAYLTARLVDLFLGDWDRHADQWKWARYTNDDKKLWYPIPRDRDQAFAKFDGLLPWISTWFLPQFNHFDYNYSHIENITWNGRFVDRRYLTEIDRETWDSVTVFVHSRLTDKLIDSAITKLPPEMYPLAVEELSTKLKSRRDQLLKISDDYYKMINHVVDIYTSDKDDYIEINRINNDQTKIVYYKKNKKKGGAKDNPLYEKVFDNNLTDEFRIFTLEGDDQVKLTGEVNSSPLVRIITGKGKDEVIDSSVVNGYFLSITPIPSAENKTRVYDSGKKTKVTFGPSTSLDTEKMPQPKDDEERYRPLQRDRRNEWFWLPIADYNTDDGVSIGINPIVTKYDFREKPYSYKWDMVALYATKPNEIHFQFDGTYRNILRDGEINFQAVLSSLVFTKYFGFGNETDFDRELEEDDFYRLKNRILHIKPTFEYELFENNITSFGISFTRSNFRLDNKYLLADFRYGDYGVGNFDLIAFHLGFNYDSRDSEVEPRKGFYFDLHGAFYPAWWDVVENFQRITADARIYFSLDTFTQITLALRAGGEKVWNKFPFFGAAFTGGSNSLRGYSRERFSGDAAVFGQAELRFKIANVFILLPGELGAFVFTDTGRVFVNGDNSSLWHSSLGGGLTLGYLDRMFSLVAGLAESKERTTFSFGFEMMF